MNVDMLAPDELVFHGIGAPAGFAGAGAGLPTRAAAVRDGLPAGVGVAAGDAPRDAGAAQRTAMRSIDVMSGFVLHRMCQMISTGVRIDKGFKEVYLNQVARALQEFSGNDVTGTQIYDHLRKWRGGLGSPN